MTILFVYQVFIYSCINIHLLNPNVKMHNIALYNAQSRHLTCCTFQIFMVQRPVKAPNLLYSIFTIAWYNAQSRHLTCCTFLEYCIVLLFEIMTCHIVN